MTISFGTNIRITITDTPASPALTVTIAGLPAGVDLEKEDFMRGPDAEEPQFGEGRLLCRDGSFVTDGRPFTLIFGSGSLTNAIEAAGVMARHIIAPIRITSIPGSAGECLCTCMPAGLQISRAAVSIPGLCKSAVPEEDLQDGMSDGRDLHWKISLTENEGIRPDATRIAESLAAISIADSLFF